ncbi:MULTISPECIES: hypothetical protein [unclassified Frankia]
MIVEDDSGTGERLAAVLRALRHGSGRCPDGAAALARAARGPVDLVLL